VICEKELVTKLYQDNVIDSLLTENSEIEKKREEIRSTAFALKKCLAVLNDFESKY
jgi:hypothetical protein